MTEVRTDNNNTNKYNNTANTRQSPSFLQHELKYTTTTLTNNHHNHTDATAALPTHTPNNDTTAHNSLPNDTTLHSRLADLHINSAGAHGLLSDHKFLMGIAEHAAQLSEDPITKVGACIVDAQQRIVGVGYNKFPPNYSSAPYTWTKDANDKLNDKRTYVLHAEAVAIMDRSTLSLRDATLYSTLLPCNECAKLIIQAGIRQVYYLCEKEQRKWVYDASRRMLDAAHVTVIQLKK